jgi:hypothetical protein
MTHNSWIVKIHGETRRILIRGYDNNLVIYDAYYIDHEKKQHTIQLNCAMSRSGFDDRFRIPLD